MCRREIASELRLDSALLDRRAIALT